MLLTKSTTFIIGPVATLLGYIMNGIFWVQSQIGIESIGLCIILFTIVIYMLLMPLTIKQQKFSKLQSKMNPELQAIQKKYKDKRQDQAAMMKMNEETQAVYQKYGVNPMGSCLQLIIQMPILFALYRVIWNIPAYVGTVKNAFLPLAQALIRAGGGYVAAPSANTSGRPSPTMASHVEEDLDGKIDMILDGGPVGIGLESTIVDFTEEIPTILRPGYINQEMVRRVIGQVQMDRGLIQADSKVKPKAPGMKYRHYAPKADLTVVEGSTKAVQEKICALVEEKIRAGEKVGVIATEESIKAYPEGIVKCIGTRADEESIARHLFAVLREFDDCGVTYIYSEAFDTPQMGQAIMNRLMKAAGQKKIQV